MHSPNAPQNPADPITSRFAHQDVPTTDGPILMKVTCLQCGTAFTVELGWLLQKEREHLERCDAPIRIDQQRKYYL